MSRLNLYRAICHSFKNFLYLVPWVIDLTPFPQVLVALFSAPVWCFSFRSLFNLQGTRPACGTVSIILPAKAFVNPFFEVFYCFFFLHKMTFSGGCAIMVTPYYNMQRRDDLADPSGECHLWKTESGAAVPAVGAERDLRPQ